MISIIFWLIIGFLFLAAIGGVGGLIAGLVERHQKGKENEDSQARFEAEQSKKSALLKRIKEM
jgi:gas vesicle protein